jgi:hypothetical protein
LSYNGKGGSSYGNQKRGSRFHFGRGKKKETELREVVAYREPEPKIPQENIVWTPRPLDVGSKIVLCTPTTLSQNGAKFLLSNDLAAQEALAYQISLLGESNKLEIEAFRPNGECKKFKIIRINSQTPNDKPVSFADMTLIGNLKNSLKSCGFTIVER